MFLSILRRPAFDRVRDDQGSSLLPVIGLLAVAAIVTVTITVSTWRSIGITSSTRAGVQAQAAADAGVAFAQSQIERGMCPADGQVDRSYGQIDSSRTGADASRPYFEATIQHKIALTGTWSNGCPTPLLGDLLNYQVRIESTGYADTPGLAGVSGLDTHTVEAVYGWSILATPPSTDITPTGAAVYAYSSSGFGAGGVLYSVDGSVPDIEIKNGNVVCSGNAEGVQNMVVDGGSLTIKQGCDIAGNAWSNGRAVLEGGVTVGGHVIGAGVTYTSSGAIGGSVWSSADLIVNGAGRIAGTAVASSLSLTNGRIGGDVWVTGGTTLNWGGFAEKNVTTKTYTQPSGQPTRNFVGGTVTTMPGGVPASAIPPAPPRPGVPNWIDFSFDASDWVGFTVVTMSGSACSFSNLQSKVNSLGGQPGVIDARLCTNGIRIDGSSKLQLANDTAIIARKFVLTAGGGMRANADTRLWLITPDPPGLLGGILTPTPQPNCPGASLLPPLPAGEFTISGDFDFSPNIATMIYTPCRVNLGTGIDTLRGQLFVGQATIDGGATLGYVKVGLPGVDLDTGQTQDGGIIPPILDLGSLGELDYYRDLPGPTVP